MRIQLLFSFCILAMPLPAMAIYKCEAHGRIVYSDLQCDGERVTELSKNLGAGPSAPLTAKQQARKLAEEAHQKTAFDKQAAREASMQRQAARANTLQQKKCAALALRKKWSDEDAENAPRKSREKAQLRAHRMGEKYTLECQQ